MGQSISGKAKIIADSLARLKEYIFSNGLRGFDPFDALASPLFRLPFFRTNRVLRLGAQQILKRLPVNIRTVLGIREGYNPVTLGLVLQGIIYTGGSSNGAACAFEENGFLVGELDGLQSSGCAGTGWGYDFDWQGRYASLPAYTPTVVATGIITNALFLLGGSDPRAPVLCRNAADFVLRDLHRTQQGETFCFSYSPLDRQVVFNASAIGARLLAQVYSVTRDRLLLGEAQKAISFVVNHQKPDGSWPYSKGDARTWVDNFHSGYILDCLDEYGRLSGDDRFERQLRKGLAFYIDNFLYDNTVPKYYNDHLYPVDATSASQSILTLARFGRLDLATNVATWMIANMQDEAGYFYYQKHRYYTNRISYMRWSNAWMFAALSYLSLKLGSRQESIREGC